MNAEQAYLYILSYIIETGDIWESAGKNDHKVGKRLKALSGMLPGYDAELDQAFKILREDVSEEIRQFNKTEQAYADLRGEEESKTEE